VRRLFKHKIIVFLIIATIVALVIIGLFSKSDRGTSFVERGGGDVLTPVQSAATSTGGFFANIGNYFGSVKTLREENERLKNENVDLQKQILDMRGLESENTELRKMLDLLKKETRIDMIAASVSAKDPSNWVSSFKINRGENHGIEKNQPVVNSNRELVGQVSRVGDNWAEVITILDPQSSVGVMVERSKEIGILEGSSDLLWEGKCRLGYISRDTDIKHGDFIETSGLGGIFPKGLVIGMVTEVYDENATMSKAATIAPISNIGKLNEVFVITDYTETDLSESQLLQDEDEEDEDENEEDEDIQDDEEE